MFDLSRRAQFGMALLAAATLGPLVPARAHISLERGAAPADSTYKAVLRVPHGCEGAATTGLKVKIPNGLIAVKPMPKPGWTLTTTTAPYDKTYDYFGKPMSQGVVEIAWTGGSLPDDNYDEFVFQGRLAKELTAGALALPIMQECAKGSTAWTEIAAPGADPHALKHPAPVLLVQAPGPAHGQAATHMEQPPVKVGALTISGAFTRQPPKGARVAGGFLTVVNGGAEIDRLVGGSATFAKRFEVHEMAMDGGMMKMRELPKGLEIKPGEKVELKPGGYHLMFLDLVMPPAPGQPVKAKLRFEKAGEVEVEFAVLPMTEGAPKGAHQH